MKTAFKAFFALCVIAYIASMFGGQHSAESSANTQMAATPIQAPKIDASAKKAREDELVALLKRVPSSDLQKNHDYYAELCGLDPANVSYKKKLAHYQGKIKKAKDAQKAREKLWGPAPVQSGWDGSYYEVKRFLKQSANDPDSIAMAGCTDVSFVSGKGWLVGCNYRGKNAFGGLIKTSNWFIIRHGQVVKMEPGDAYSAH